MFRAGGGRFVSLVCSVWSDIPMMFHLRKLRFVIGFLFFFTALCAWMLPVCAQSPGREAGRTAGREGSWRLAVVDGRRLEKGLDRVREIERQVAEHFRERRQGLAEVRERLERLAAEVQNTGLPLDVRKEKQKEGETLEEIYREEQKRLRQDEERFREALLSVVRVEVLQFMARYAREQGIDAIFDVARARLPYPVLLFASSSVDISDDVIRRFNELPPPGSAPAPNSR